MIISNNSCRICLKDPNSNENFHNYMKSIDDIDENSSFSYSEKFTMCTGINISLDNLLAKKLCNQCMKMLNDSFNFLVDCKKSEIILQNYIRDKMLKNESNMILPKVTFGTPGLNDKAQLLLQENINSTSSTIINTISKTENIEFLSVHKFETIFSDDSNDDIERIDNFGEFNENPINENLNEIQLDIEKNYKLNKLEENNNTKLIDLKIEKKPKYCRKIKSPKIKEPETPIICDICGKFYKDRKRLKNHRHLHTGEKNFKCPICDRGFALQGYIRGHMLTHTGERNFQCSFCDKKFYRACIMRIHEKKHNLQRNFECQICNKKYKLSNHLKRHMRIHNDERPYSCELCGVSFGRDHHLKQHMKTRAHRNLMTRLSQEDLTAQLLKKESILLNE